MAQKVQSQMDDGQGAEFFIRKSPATAKPSAETGHSSIVLSIDFPFGASLSLRSDLKNGRINNALTVGYVRSMMRAQQFRLCTSWLYR